MLWSQFCFSHRPTRENTWVLKNLSSVPDQRPWLNQSESKQATKWLIHDTRWELWWCGESLSRACLFLHSAFLWGFTSQPRPQSIPLSARRVRCLRLKQRNHRQTHIRYYFIAEKRVCVFTSGLAYSWLMKAEIVMCTAELLALSWIQFWTHATMHVDEMLTYLLQFLRN